MFSPRKLAMLVCFAALAVAPQAAHAQLTAQDVRDTRIEVHAQFALMRLSKGSTAERRDARAMLAAVKSGRLAGIYKADLLVPAQRARKLFTYWWKIIPKGQDAMLVPGILERPMIIFRPKIRSDKARLDPALRAAWREFSHPAPRAARRLPRRPPSRLPRFRSSVCPAPAVGTPSRTPNASTDYLTLAIRGWPIHINARTLGRFPKLVGAVLYYLDKQLALVNRRMPRAARGKLHRSYTGIWVEYRDVHKGIDRLSYHPSLQWLQQNGYNPMKTGQIEIPFACKFVAAFGQKTQPAQILHELAHAYHHKVLGHGDARIIKAHQAAAASGRYSKVDRYQPPHRIKEAHYGMGNKEEFFAEFSESYLAENDFFPFNNAQLRQYDPAIYKLMAQIWGPPPAARSRAGLEAAPSVACRHAGRTGRSGKRSVLRVHNRSRRTIKLYWINYQGKRQHYATLRRGQRRDFDTFGGHRWMVTDARGRCLRVYVAANDNRIIRRR